jgi:peptidoglycan-associated lipoprotein
VVSEHIKQIITLGGNMKKTWTLKLCLMMILSLMLVVSCGKKKVATEGAAPAKVEAPAATDDASKNKADNTAAAATDEGTKTEAAAVDTTAGVDPEMENNVYFDFDSSVIRSSEIAALQKEAAMLKANPKKKVTIEGHCDERGTAEYNIALGDRRAASAKAYLKKLGVAASRMKTVSYGKEKPVALGHDEDAWAKNRRAHLNNK